MPSDTSTAPYDDGLYALLTLFLGSIVLGGVVAHAGSVALVVGFPTLLALAVGLEAWGRRR